MLCLYGLFGTSLRPKVSHVEICISCVYKHGLSACIWKQVYNSRESTQRGSRKMEPLRLLAVMLSTVLSGTVGNHALLKCNWSWQETNGYFFSISSSIHTVSCEGSVILTQTHPTAPYVCRTGNIILRCQYDGVEGVSTVLWSIGNETTTTNPSTIPGHTILPPTTTYLEIVVDSYTNLHEKYECAPLQSGTSLPSNEYKPQIERKHNLLYSSSTSEGAFYSQFIEQLSRCSIYIHIVKYVHMYYFVLISAVILISPIHYLVFGTIFGFVCAYSYCTVMSAWCILYCPSKVSIISV